MVGGNDSASVRSGPPTGGTMTGIPGPRSDREPVRREPPAAPDNGDHALVRQRPPACGRHVGIALVGTGDELDRPTAHPTARIDRVDRPLDAGQDLGELRCARRPFEAEHPADADRLARRLIRGLRLGRGRLVRRRLRPLGGSRRRRRDLLDRVRSGGCVWFSGIVVATAGEPSGGQRCQQQQSDQSRGTCHVVSPFGLRKRVTAVGDRPLRQ